MTIYWNSISGVYTINRTGQLIQFVIGLFGLAKVNYEPMKIVRHRSTFPSFRLLTEFQWYSNGKAVSIPEEGGGPSQEAAHEPNCANHRLEFLDLSTTVDQSTLDNSWALRLRCSLGLSLD